MLLLEQGNYRLVVADDNDYSAIKYFVKYFNLPRASHRVGADSDWMLEDGSVVSVSRGDDHLIV